MRCGKCRVSWYCSATCQTKHWKAGHKHKCVAAVCKPSAAGAPSSARAAASAAPAEVDEDNTCSICLFTLADPVVLECRHRFCNECIQGMYTYSGETAPACPMCRATMPDVKRLYLASMCGVLRYARWRKRNTRADGQEPALTPEMRHIVRDAIGACQEGLRAAPTHALLLSHLGYLLVIEGEYDEAETAFHASIKSDPAITQTYMYMGSMMMQKEQFPRAIYPFNELLKREPHNTPVKKRLAYVYYRMGIAQGQLSNYDAALALFEQALTLDPTDEDARKGVRKIKAAAPQAGQRLTPARTAGSLLF